MTHKRTTHTLKRTVVPGDWKGTLRQKMDNAEYEMHKAFIEMQEASFEMEAAYQAMRRELRKFKLEVPQLQEYSEKRRSAAIKAGQAEARRLGKKWGGPHRKSKINLKELRALKKSGLTQAEIARKLGKTQARISQLLKKGRKR
jgi:DNA invertase Pin-like site-specific DNA recombinase